MHTKCVAWWCGACSQKNGPEFTHCIRCHLPYREHHAHIHSADRAVVYVNPVTGERRTPPRADMPMPSHYVEQGYERKEIMSMIQYEKETGVVHEASNYNDGNEPIPTEPAPPRPSRAAIEAVAEDIKEAIASGPWTDSSGLLDL